MAIDYNYGNKVAMKVLIENYAKFIDESDLKEMKKKLFDKN